MRVQRRAPWMNDEEIEMKPLPGRWCAVAISLLLAGGASAPAGAATITVTSNQDTGPGSFRQAVASAVAGDTINFNLAWPATIAILQTPLYFTKSITIDGPGADKLTFDGNHAGSPLFQTHFSASLTISGVTIRRGGSGAIYVPGNAQSLTLRHCAVVDNIEQALLVWGNLTVDDCVFSGNLTTNISTTDYGSAIYVGRGVASISNSTFAGNDSSDGCGAIYNGGSMTIRNSTFSDNRTIGTNSSQGGAICSPGALAVEASTFTGNYARGYGGTLLAGNGTLTSSTFRDNSSGLGGDGINGGPGLIVSRSILQGCVDAVTSGGDNLVSDGSCFPASAGLNDRIGLDPRLGELANNGGPTKTVALQAGSPAIDQVIANAAGCSGSDQRGVARPLGVRCDIGAFERDTDRIFASGFD